MGSSGQARLAGQLGASKEEPPLSPMVSPPNRRAWLTHVAAGQGSEPARAEAGEASLGFDSEMVQHSSRAFHWPKEITWLAQISKVEKQAPPLGGREF